MESDSKIRLAVNRLHYPVTSLGPGRRAAIWTQGCSIGCRGCGGCVSKDTWDTQPATTDVGDIADWMLAHEPDGVTISGGEPLDQAAGIALLIRELRSRGPDLDVLLYTGYSWSVAQKRHPWIVELVDVVVAGPYRLNRPSTSPLCGSANQTIHILTERASKKYESYLAQSSDRCLQVAVDD